MNWDAIEALGFVFAIGAIGLLLSAGLKRLHDHAIRLAVSNNDVESFSQIALNISRDRDFKQIWETGMAGMAKFSDDFDRTRFVVFLGVLLRYYESSYIQWSKGELDNELWSDIETQISSMMVYPGFHDYWSRRKQQHSEIFQRLIDEVFGSPDNIPLLGGRAIVVNNKEPAGEIVIQ